MKRLAILSLTILLIGSLAIAGYAETASRGSSLNPQVNWSWDPFIILYIPSSDISVDLGSIDSSLVNSDGSWGWLSEAATNHEAWVVGSGSYNLTVNIDTRSNANGDFAIKGNGKDWNTISGTAVSLVEGGSGITQIDDIQYRYKPSWSDNPINAINGSFVTLTYTATSS